MKYNIRISIRITETTSSDSKALVPPLMLGSDSGYNKIGLRRVEFTYTNKIISNIIHGVNDLLWYKAIASPLNFSVAVPEGFYDSQKIVCALNQALSAVKPSSMLINLANRSSTGIRFSDDADDRIIMQVIVDFFVLLGTNSRVINYIGDTLGFSSNLQGTYDAAMVGGTPYEAIEKAMYFSGTYKAWNKMQLPDNSGVKWISIDCDLVDPSKSYVEHKKGFLEQSSSLYLIDIDDIDPGEKIDVHVPNVLLLPTRGDIDGVSSIKISLTDQNKNTINTITDVIATIEISK